MKALLRFSRLGPFVRMDLWSSQSQGPGRTLLVPEKCLQEPKVDAK